MKQTVFAIITFALATAVTAAGQVYAQDSISYDYNTIYNAEEFPCIRGVTQEEALFLDSFKAPAKYRVVGIKKKQGWYKIFLKRADFSDVFVVVSQSTNSDKSLPKIKKGEQYTLSLIPQLYWGSMIAIGVYFPPVLLVEDNKVSLYLENSIDGQKCFQALFKSPEIVSNRYKVKSEELWFENIGSRDKISYNVEVCQSSIADSIGFDEYTNAGYSLHKHRFIVDKPTFGAMKDYVMNYKPRLVSSSPFNYMDFGTHLVTIDCGSYQLQKTLYSQENDGYMFFTGLIDCVKDKYPRLASELTAHAHQAQGSDFHKPHTPCVPLEEGKKKEIKVKIYSESDNPEGIRYAIRQSTGVDTLGMVMVEEKHLAPWEVYTVDASTFELLENHFMAYQSACTSYGSTFGKKFTIRMSIDYGDHERTKCVLAIDARFKEFVRKLANATKKYPQLTDRISKMTASKN